jgi:general L-amino acid transport system permease protein
MAQTSPPFSSNGQPHIPFYRDGRVLGILAQIIFVIAVALFFAWIAGNISQNMGRLGAFRCADGSESFGCSFNFLNTQSQFDISESVIEYSASNTFGRAILAGLANTAKVAFFGIILATLLGTFTGIARLSNNWLVSNIAKWYIDIIRNTPLLLQLFFIYFGVIVTFPRVSEAIQPFGLPVFLSQRGINTPSLVTMPTFSTWAVFLVIGIVAAVAVWFWLGRLERQREQDMNRFRWSFLAFALLAAVGWLVASRALSDQATLAHPQTGVAEIGALAAQFSPENPLIICGVQGDKSEVNLGAILRGNEVAWKAQRSTSYNAAARAFANGECGLLTANRAQLENTAATVPGSVLIDLPESPVRLSYPVLEGFNFSGGGRLTPGFAALLIGLVLFTGAFIAEIVRAGIMSVPKGQSEAARALGLNEAQRLQLVVLPQALRVIIPPLTSQYLNLTKNSSLAIAVGFPDLWSTSFVTMNQSGQSLPVFLIAMACYLTFSLLISAVLNWYNQRIALVER